MICSSCSTEIPDGSQFCSKCGARVDVLPPPAPPYSAPPSSPLPPGVEPPTSGKAIGSLIAGIFFLFFPAAVVAIILGHISLSQIRKSAGRLKGRGLATAGLILGYMGIAFIPIVLIIAAIAIPNLLRARMTANEASAVGSVRTFTTALVSYASQCPQGFPASTEQLGPGPGDCTGANLIDASLASPRALKDGYILVYHPGRADDQGHVSVYVISADPVVPGSTGMRHFYADESGVIRFETSRPAGPDSQPLE
jgi:type IV pilus assembly protein PilA